MSDQHQYSDLINIFDGQFAVSHNTRLIRGQDEPIYLPADSQCDYHRVVFAHGFYASALHEIAHWCIAGEERRLLEDFGYWYCPDGRDQATQEAFEKVEVKPQAVEWAMAAACGFPFNVSADNLNGWQPDRLAFQHRVYQQVLHYLAEGFPPRAEQLIRVMGDFYQVAPLTAADFEFEGRQRSDNE